MSLRNPYGSRRIPRKPAPTITQPALSDDRFPDMDPNDPFAPLWLLRRRGDSLKTDKPTMKQEGPSSSDWFTDALERRSESLDRPRTAPTFGYCPTIDTTPPTRSCTPSGSSVASTSSSTTELCTPETTQQLFPSLASQFDGSDADDDYEDTEIPTLVNLGSPPEADINDHTYPAITLLDTIADDTLSTVSQDEMVVEIKQQTPKLTIQISPPDSSTRRNFDDILPSPAQYSFPNNPVSDRKPEPPPLFPISAVVGLPPPTAKSNDTFQEQIRRISTSCESDSRTCISHSESAVPFKFKEHALPSVAALEAAAEHHVINDDGIRRRFGDIWKGKKTIVIFIRHFWCPLCQDYMRSLSRIISLAKQALIDSKVDVCIVGNGDWALLKGYRRIFNLPSTWHLMTEPTLTVHAHLGMANRSVPTSALPSRTSSSRAPSYVKHSALVGTGKVVLNALRVGMPFWCGGGKISQLGGEFVLGPGLTCSFAHRMPNPKGHAPILRVLRAANVQLPQPLLRQVTPPEYDETIRQREREFNLEEMNQRKWNRRCSNFISDIEELETESEAIA